MQRVLILSTALVAACAASGAAMAQTSGAQTSASQTSAGQTATGLRYLSWPGKPAVAHTPTLRRIAPQPTPVATFDAPRPLAVARLDAPAAAAATTTRRGLTPASDWAPAPTPLSVSAADTTLQPYVPSRDVAVDAPTPPVRAETAPDQIRTPVSNALPEQVLVEAQGQAEAAPAFDPMAPRRDAPIFRLQAQTVAEAPRPSAPQAPESSPAPAAQTSAKASAQPEIVQAALSPAPVQGVRFYSVHRQAGRRPDPINAVQPIYLDALPVEMTQTPSSADLARPDAPPALLRNSDGTVRAAPQTEGDDLP